MKFSLQISPSKTISSFLGDSVLITVQGAQHYRWSHGDTTSTIYVRIVSDSSMSVIGYNKTCNDTAFIQLKLISPTEGSCYVDVPNAFSPNGDLKNDFLEINRSCTINIINFDIYDRYGEKVFSGTSHNNYLWNGEYKGILQTPQVFVYYLSYELGNNITIKKGSIALIR